MTGRFAKSSKIQGIGNFVVRKERISKLAERGFTKIELNKLVAPPRTLARRHETLSLEESDRVQRLERILEQAIRVLGSGEKANKWLRSKNRALNNAIPIDLLVSETGAHQIEMQLHAIDYGMYA
ncbi:MAG: antitoxin Xre/MbcA/ParS toxin-binding domain-containing protein [Pseudomonadota bacterium]